MPILKRFKYRFRRIQCPRQILIRMRAGNKAGFIRGWRHVHALFQHAVIKAFETRGVAGANLLEAADIIFLAKEETEHAADLINRQRNVALLRAFAQAFGQLLGLSVTASKKPGCEISARFFKPAAIATGLPDRVPA